eukprot:356503-Chlamydomonas_euryale.AAC.4
MSIPGGQGLAPSHLGRTNPSLLQGHPPRQRMLACGRARHSSDDQLFVRPGSVSLWRRAGARWLGLLDG